MSTFESLILGAFAILLVFLMRPGLRAAMQKSREAENKDWSGVIWPLIVVVLFVLFLIAMARSTGSHRTVAPDDLIDTSTSVQKSPTRVL